MRKCGSKTELKTGTIKIKPETQETHRDTSLTLCQGKNRYENIYTMKHGHRGGKETEM